MGSRKVVKKKKRIEPRVAKRKDVLVLGSQPEEINKLFDEKTMEYAKQLKIEMTKVDEAIECLKNYTKKDQIGDLANPAIELLTKWNKI